jgi:hypothetical protein
MIISNSTTGTNPTILLHPCEHQIQNLTSNVIKKHLQTLPWLSSTPQNSCSYNQDKHPLPNSPPIDILLLSSNPNPEKYMIAFITFLSNSAEAGLNHV